MNNGRMNILLAQLTYSNHDRSTLVFHAGIFVQVMVPTTGEDLYWGFVKILSLGIRTLLRVPAVGLGAVMGDRDR